MDNVYGRLKVFHSHVEDIKDWLIEGCSTPRKLLWSDGIELDSYIVDLIVRSNNDRGDDGLYDVIIEMLVSDVQKNEIASGIFVQWDDVFELVVTDERGDEVEDNLGVLFTLSIDEIEMKPSRICIV